MKKKYFIIGGIILVIIIAITIALLMVKGNKSKTKEISCIVGNSGFTMKFKNGQVTEYVDNEYGPYKEETITAVNEQYLSNTTSNNDASNIINDTIVKQGGECK